LREYGIGLPLALDEVVPAADLEHLRRLGRALSLGRGARVYRQGEAAEQVFLLLSGRVKSVMVSASGQEALLRLHLPGNLLGLSALGSDPVREADAVVTEAAELAAIPRAAFASAMASRPGLAAGLVRLLVDRMRDFHLRVGEVAALSVEQRVARALLSLSRPDPMEGGLAGRPVTLTHEEFAQLLGTRRPTASATLARLAAAGLIRSGRGRIEVLDRAGLAALLPEGISADQGIRELSAR